jgi:hypothetical protein
MVKRLTAWHLDLIYCGLLQWKAGYLSGVLQGRILTRWLSFWECKYFLLLACYLLICTWSCNLVTTGISNVFQGLIVSWCEIPHQCSSAAPTCLEDLTLRQKGRLSVKAIDSLKCSAVDKAKNLKHCLDALLCIIWLSRNGMQGCY